MKPAYAPIDEDRALYPESSYALSKVCGEEMARQVSRWNCIAIVGLRFSNIMEPADYAAFPGFQDNPMLRKWNLWGYGDARDVAKGCRLRLEANLKGAEAFIIAAADTALRRPNRELLAAIFPGVPRRPGTGENGTLLLIEMARRLLPTYSWRDAICNDILGILEHGFCGAVPQLAKNFCDSVVSTDSIPDTAE